MQPEPATAGSAGIDLRACIEDAWVIRPGDVALAPSGLRIAVPDGHTALLFPRSGQGHKRGLVLGNLVGVIDSDYRGEAMISAWNRTGGDLVIEPLERIAQMVVVPILQPQIEIVDSLDETERAAGGFGHTGES